MAKKGFNRLLNLGEEILRQTQQPGALMSANPGNEFIRIWPAE